MSILKEIEALYQSYTQAYRSKDARGCAAIYTEDAEVFSPYDLPSRGRKAIELAHQEWVNLGGVDALLKITIVQAGGSESLAWSLNAYDDGEEAGTSLNVYERQPNGSLLVRMCSLNSDTPNL